MDLNFKADIAIFRPCPESCQYYGGLEWRSLTFERDFDHFPEGAQSKGIQCFVVGYASDDTELSQQFRDDRKAMTPMLYDQVIAKNPKTLYEYIWYNSHETLTTSPEGKIIEKQMRPSDKVYRSFRHGLYALLICFLRCSGCSRQSSSQPVEHWPWEPS